MCGFGDPGFVASIAKAVAKSLLRERLACLPDDEMKVSSRTLVERLLEGREDRVRDFCTCFCRSNRGNPAFDMLPSKQDRIPSAQACIEHNVQPDPFLCPRGPSSLIARDVFFCPGRKASCLFELQSSNTSGWVVFQEASFYRLPKNSAHGLEEVVGGCWCREASLRPSMMVFLVICAQGALPALSMTLEKMLSRAFRVAAVKVR